MAIECEFLGASESRISEGVFVHPYVRLTLCTRTVASRIISFPVCMNGVLIAHVKLTGSFEELLLQVAVISPHVLI